MSETKENTAEEVVKNQESVSEDTTQEKQAEDPNKVVLLGTISYNNEKEYTEWLSKMDVNQAIFVLIASANYSQSKGVYNIAESELISSAIRSIKKHSTPAETEATEEKQTS
jgi:hypothetical protein